MTAHEMPASPGRPAADMRSPDIVLRDGTALVHLSMAISDYEHVREITQGIVRADGIALTPLIFPSIEEITFRFTRSLEWDVSELSFGKYISLTSQGDRRDGGDPGVSFARAPPFGDLCAQRPRHQDREGSRRPHGRHSRMGADRRHLCARLPGRGIWRRSRQGPLAAGGRQRARPHGKGRAQTAVGDSLRVAAAKRASTPCWRAARSMR